MKIKFSNLLYGAFALSLGLLTSCGKDSGNNEATIGQHQSVPSSNVVVNKNNTSLSGRVVYHTESVTADVKKSSKEAITIDIPAEAAADGFSSVATVIPMIDPNGQTLSATCVQQFGNYAVISYHLHDKAMGGGLELVDVTDPLHPVSISQIYIKNRDFNHIVFENSDISNSKFWALADDPIKGQTFLIEGSLSNLDFSSSLSEVRIYGSSGNNAILFGDELLIATSASKDKTGYFQSYNYKTKTLSTESENMAVQRGKHLDFKGQSVISLALENCSNSNTSAGGTSTGDAILRYYEQFSNFATPATNEVNLGSINPIDGKNTIRLKGTTAYLALGKKGFHAVDVTTGNIIGSYVNPQGIANGVDVDSKNVYIANGSGGIIVLDAQSLSYKYAMFTGYTSSSNYISINEDQNILFVANGVSGTRIISTNGGTLPALCTSYAGLVKGSNSIYKSAKSVFNSTHPTVQQIFADGDAVPSYYEILENTNLYVTFTASTAANKDVLGYFVVPAGEDIESYYTNIVRPEFKKDKPVNMDYVLFSSLSSTNCLYQSGDYVTINNLKAGEKVVFFIIQWIGKDTEPIIFTGSSGILTTVKALNPYDNRYFQGNEYGENVKEEWKAPASFKYQLNGTFYSVDCNVIVTTFEDINSTSCDNDYTDVVFGVSDNLNGVAPTKFRMDKPILKVDSNGLLVD